MSVIPRVDHSADAPPRSSPRGTPAWDLAATDASLEPVADVLRALFAPHVRSGGGSARRVSLRLDDHDGDGDESYVIDVNDDGITCVARTAAGVFRAATTAGQLIAFDELARRRLHDHGPVFAWRGLLIDPARHFIAADDVRRVIDLAALYKLNVLHLHLTDNEGWRVAISGMPELTTGDDHYTAADYRDLQRYAAERHVTIVPEIDLPGHCAALLAARSELRTAVIDDDAVNAFAAGATSGPIRAPLDLRDPATAAVIEAILADVCARTTGPYVHIGTDETMGMSHDDFVHAVRWLRATVRDAGKTSIGWQESSRAGVEPRDIGQFWVDSAMMSFDRLDEFVGTPEAVAMGLTREVADLVRSSFAPTDDDLGRIVAGGGRVVLSPLSHLYLDRPYAPESIPDAQAEQVAGLGLPVYPPIRLDEAAAWDPRTVGVPPEQVLGIEATLWGETLRSADDLTTMLLPRLAAIAETAWAGSPPSWPEYRRRLARHGRLWRERGLAYLAATEVTWHDDSTP